MRQGSLVLFALAAIVCSAHQFWVQPARFRVAPGERVEVSLLVGDGFPGESRARKPSHVRSFFAHTPDGRVEIEGAEGADPAGAFVAGGRGVITLVYESNASGIELGGAQFEAYLREEGLEHVIELRAAAGESDRPGREAYSRVAKALVLVGEDPGAFAAWSEPLALPIELVPETNPYAMADKGRFRVRLLRDGVPAPGVLVKALRRNADALEAHDAAHNAGEDHSHAAWQSARTDELGVAELVLDGPGQWLLAAVMMERVSDNPAHDWRSLWASLTFELAPGE